MAITVDLLRNFEGKVSIKEQLMFPLFRYRSANHPCESRVSGEDLMKATDPVVLHSIHGATHEMASHEKCRNAHSEPYIGDAATCLPR